MDEKVVNNNNNKSITTTAATASSSGVEEEIITPKMTPMMVEERARTIREVKEEETHQHLSPSTSSSSSSSSSSSLSYQTGKEKKFVLYLNIMLSIENAAIERLHARIQQSPLAEVREQLNGQGLEVSYSAPDEFAAYVKAESARWTKLIKELGIKEKAQ